MRPDGSGLHELTATRGLVVEPAGTVTVRFCLTAGTNIGEYRAI